MMDDDDFSFEKFFDKQKSNTIVISKSPNISKTNTTKNDKNKKIENHTKKKNQ